VVHQRLPWSRQDDQGVLGEAQLIDPREKLLDAGVHVGHGAVVLGDHPLASVMPGGIQVAKYRRTA